MVLDSGITLRYIRNDKGKSISPRGDTPLYIPSGFRLQPESREPIKKGHGSTMLTKQARCDLFLKF